MSPALVATAQALVGTGRGLLAMDESISTCNRRFAASGIAQTEEMRRAYRELLVTAPGLADAQHSAFPGNRRESALFSRALTIGRPITAAIALVCAGLALPCAAQTLECPQPQAMHGPGVLKETPVQIAEIGNLLASGDSVNRVPEVLADLRRRYPGVRGAELQNYLVTAYCPVVAKLNGLSVAKQQAQVEQFAHQASIAVYGH